MIKKMVVFSILISVHFVSALVSFTQAPVLEIKGEVGVVKFSISEPSDVEVAVVDKDGKVAKHLAQGLLGGEKAPPLPLVAGLSQSIEWNGRGDDEEMLTERAPLKIRVRLGVVPTYEKEVKIKDYITPQLLNGDQPQYTKEGAINSTLINGDLISLDHPVWTVGGPGGIYKTSKALTGANPDTAKVVSNIKNIDFTKTPPETSWKVLLYGGVYSLDIAVSNETEDLIIKQQLNANCAPAIIRYNVITGTTSQWPRTNALWFPWAAFPELTAPLNPNNGEPYMDWRGRYVLHDAQGAKTMYRLRLDGTPYRNNTDYIIIDQKRQNGDYRQRGADIGPDGSIYIARYPDSSDKSPQITKYMDVTKLDSNGNRVQYNLIKSFATISQGVRVDRKGNLFIGVRMTPVAEPVPNQIKDKLTGLDTDPYSLAYLAKKEYGSIVKFGPEGGTIVPSPGSSYVGGGFGTEQPVALNGAKWVVPGVSFQNGKTIGSTCICQTSRFDVDYYGRVIFPNSFENEFRAVDNEGNLLFRVKFRDLFAKNNVLMGFANSVQATDRGLYVADFSNNHVVIFKWQADAEATLDVPEGLKAELASTGGLLTLSTGPNPFTSMTTIRLNNLNRMDAERATLKIFSAAGQVVADLSPEIRQGTKTVQWNGAKMGSGIYYCKLMIGGKSFYKTLMLTK